MRKFDPLFNLEEDGPRELGITPAGGYRIRSNRLPLLPYNEEMTLVRNEHMLLKYDLERRTYERHDISSCLLYEFPSTCDLHNGCFFVAGGLRTDEDREPVAKAFLYETTRAKTNFLEDMHFQRYKLQLVYLEDEVFAIGGFVRGKIMSKSVEKFSLREESWADCSPMFFERAEFVAVPSRAGRCIYVCGGTVMPENSLIVERYDARRDEWA